MPKLASIILDSLFGATTTPAFDDVPTASFSSTHHISSSFEEIFQQTSSIRNKSVGGHNSTNINDVLKTSFQGDNWHKSSTTSKTNRVFSAFLNLNKVNPTRTYQLTIDTMTGRGSGSNGKVYVQFGGAKGSSDLRLLKQGWNSGSRAVLAVTAEDVGEVKWMKLFTHAHDNIFSLIIDNKPNDRQLIKMA